MKKTIWVILLALFALNAAGFVYTFVQPRYPATVISVGRARSVTEYTKHGRRRHTVVPLMVAYTDEKGNERTAEVTYSRPEGPLFVGQQIVIVQSVNGFIPYPYVGLRWFCGAVGGGIGFFLLLMRLDKKKKDKDAAPAEETAAIDSKSEGGTEK